MTSPPTPWRVATSILLTGPTLRPPGSSCPLQLRRNLHPSLHLWRKGKVVLLLRKNALEVILVHVATNRLVKRARCSVGCSVGSPPALTKCALQCVTHRLLFLAKHALIKLNLCKSVNRVINAHLLFSYKNEDGEDYLHLHDCLSNLWGRIGGKVGVCVGLLGHVSSTVDPRYSFKKRKEKNMKEQSTLAVLET